jgi:hypothetical protein
MSTRNMSTWEICEHYIVCVCAKGVHTKRPARMDGRWWSNGNKTKTDGQTARAAWNGGMSGYRIQATHV